ncbi:MAG: glycosyltransferase family 39 protein [bacterium]
MTAVHLGESSLIDWDEGVFALQSQWLASFGNQGKPFNFQTPPLYQLLIACAFRVFGFNTLILHLLALIASCLGVFIVFHLSKLLSTAQDAIIAVILFASTEFFLFFSKSGLSDAVFLCFFLASLLFFFRGLKLNKDSQFLYAGLFLVLASYTKYSAFPLFISYLIIGLLHKKSLKTKWFFYSLVLPVLLILPYFLLLIKYVHLPELSTRHISFLGVNHLKFLFYLLIFAPVPLLLALIRLFTDIKGLNKWNIFVLITTIIFFLILGFYYPYFRLAYPIVPLLAIPGAQIIKRLGKFRIPIFASLILMSLAFGFRTIKYTSVVPQETGMFVHRFAEKEEATYIYAVVPPNILYYINLEIVIPAGHPWERARKMLPWLSSREIIRPEDNKLPLAGKTLLVHATALDLVKLGYLDIYERGILVSSFEFTDAPVYYKDIYNPQRDAKQCYEVYLINNEELGAQLEDLWLFGFDRRVTVMVRQ